MGGAPGWGGGGGGRGFGGTRAAIWAAARQRVGGRQWSARRRPRRVGGRWRRAGWRPLPPTVGARRARRRRHHRSSAGRRAEVAVAAELRRQVRSGCCRWRAGTSRRAAALDPSPADGWRRWRREKQCCLSRGGPHCLSLTLLISVRTVQPRRTDHQVMISTQQESRTRLTFIEINRSRLSWTRYIRTKLMVRHAWKGKGNCLGSLPHDFRR